MNPKIKNIRLFILISGLIFANCNFIQRILPPPTPTVVPTATIAPSPVPTNTSIAAPELSSLASELTGTRWTITYDLEDEGHREYELIFYENGRLGNTHPNDKTPDNDFWRVVEDQVILTFNNEFVTYTGTLVDPDTMSGTALNINGLSWEWIANRIPE